VTGSRPLKNPVIMLMAGSHAWAPLTRCPSTPQINNRNTHANCSQAFTWSAWSLIVCIRKKEDLAVTSNELPKYDMSVNTTGCCPKFNPAGWDGQELHFRDKPFLRATTSSIMHVPVNMGGVFSRVQKHVEEAGGFDPDNVIILSRDLSPWSSEHFFSVSKTIPDEEMTTLSGDFMTKVFEGPYSQAKEWYEAMRWTARAQGFEPGKVYFFYTTCPKCAEACGKSYVVGVVEVRRAVD
jgi:hypothetical protein